MLINMAVAVVLVVSANLTGLDDYVEADEIVYSLIFFWLLISGPGKASLDTLVAKALGIRTAAVATSPSRMAIPVIVD